MTDRLVVVWRVTERCNLGCGFCKYDRHLAVPRRTANKHQILRVALALAQGPRPVHVSWLGGEPLLWSELPALTRALRKLGLSMGVTTNGTPLESAALTEHVLTDYDELTVSVDGLAATHDALRGWPGGFDRIGRSLGWFGAEKARRGAGPLLRVNTVLMRDNIAEFPALCRTLASFGVEEITFNQLGGRDRPEFFREHRLLPGHAELLARELPRWRAELAALGVRLRGSSAYAERIVATATGERIPVADCRPGERVLFLDEDGVASPCSFAVAEYGLPVRDVAGLGERFRDLRGARRLAVCDDCHSTEVCGKFAAG